MGKISARKDYKETFRRYVPGAVFALLVIQPLLDMGLLYLCASLVDGFAITSKFHALLAVMLINAVCYVAAGRK